MIRPGARRSWGGGPVRRSPFSGGGRAPFIRPVLLAVIAAAVLAIAAVVACTFLAGGPGECDEAYCETLSSDLVVPTGFEALSKIFERNPNADPFPDGFDLTIPLEVPLAAGLSLSFYGYDSERGLWAPVASAALDSTGEYATGQFADPPRYLAIFRRLGEEHLVVAYLEPGAALHPSAASLATIIHTLDFTPAGDGSLVGQPSARPSTTAAHYPVVSASAGIDGALPNVDAVLATGADRTNHVRQILQLVAAHRLAGIDIAYLDLRADLRTSFTLFVSELADGLHAQGKKLTLTLPAPVKAVDRIDEGAYDWAVLGAAADLIKIAPVRDQSAYRLYLPEVLEHVTAAVDPARLILTVTPYASEKSTDGLRRLTLTQAMTVAGKLAVRSESVTAGSEIRIVAVNLDRDEGLSGLRWQPETATVAFTYNLNGGRTVWIENAFSVGFKLEFVNVFDLGGLAVEDASDNVFLGDIWGAIESFVTTGQPVLQQPNHSDLLPRWEVTGGELVGGDRGIVTWLAPPEAGAHTVTLTLSDGVDRFESRIALVLQPAVEASARAP